MSLSVWRIKFGNLDQRNVQHLHVNYSILYPFQSHLEQACRSSIPPVKRKVQYFSKSRYCYIILFQIIILFQVAVFFHNTFPCHLETWMLPCLKRPSSAARTTSNTWKTIFVFFCYKLLTKSFIEVRFPPACLSHLICWLKSKMILTENHIKNMSQWKS